MHKSDGDDGVSRGEDPVHDDDALAEALERQFAPFAGRSPRREPEDPEVRAISTRLNETGDTLGAIDQLEALLQRRTGAIPVVTPEMLAAASARLEARDAARPVDPVLAGPAAEPAAATAPDETDDDAVVADAAESEWPEAGPVRLTGPQPSFSPWVDPAATAAALSDSGGTERTDVSTEVFAVFAAPEPAAPGRPEAAVPSPASAPADAPALAVTAGSQTAAGAEPDGDRDLDDDADDVVAGEQADFVPVASTTAALRIIATTQPTASPAPPAEGTARDAGPESGARRRGIWPFRRRDRR